MPSTFLKLLPNACFIVLGYNPVITIPAGATKINVTEIRRSKNFLGEFLFESIHGTLFGHMLFMTSCSVFQLSNLMNQLNTISMGIGLLICQRDTRWPARHFIIQDLAELTKRKSR